MNADDLKKERARRQMTQAQMAQFLGIPLSTYVKWETDKTRKKPLPSLVADKLIANSDLDFSVLSLGEVVELEQEAREEGITIQKLIGDLIREGLLRRKGLIPAILFLLALCIHGALAKRSEAAVVSSAEVAPVAARKQQADDE